MTKRQLIMETLLELEKRNPHLFKKKKLHVEKIMDAMFDVIAAELLGGGEAPLNRIGKLKARITKERRGINPRTGERITIPPRVRVKFSPFKEFKEAMRP